MAATVGNLRAILSLSPKAFNRGLMAAAGYVGGFGKKLISGGVMVAKYGAAAAAVGVGIGTYFIKQQLDAIDVTAKAAAKLGASTESLIGLQHAANLAGVSGENLSKSLSMMQRNLGDAAAGTGQAKTKLTELGLSARDMVNMTPEEQFYKISDAIAALGTQSAKAAAMQAIFGRSGMDLIPLAQQGSAVIRKEANDAKLLGMSFSNIDAAKVEMANDAVTRVKGALGGIFTQLAIKIAPFLEAGANKFLEWAKSGEGMGAKIGGVLTSAGNILSGYLIPAIQTLSVWGLRADAVFVKAFGAMLRGLTWVGEKITSVVVPAWRLMIPPIQFVAEQIIYAGQAVAQWLLPPAQQIAAVFLAGMGAAAKAISFLASKTSIFGLVLSKWIIPAAQMMGEAMWTAIGMGIRGGAKLVNVLLPALEILNKLVAFAGKMTGLKALGVEIPQLDIERLRSQTETALAVGDKIKGMGAAIGSADVTGAIAGISDRMSNMGGSFIGAAGAVRSADLVGKVGNVADTMRGMNQAISGAPDALENMWSAASGGMGGLADKATTAGMNLTNAADALARRDIGAEFSAWAGGINAASTAGAVASLPATPTTGLGIPTTFGENTNLQQQQVDIQRAMLGELRGGAMGLQ